MVRRLQVAVDCADPDRLADFWVNVLSYVLDTPPAGYTSWHDFSEAVGGSDESWSAVVDPAGNGPRILFHRVPEPKAGKNRLHLDVRVSAAGDVPTETRRRQVDAEVTRLRTVGGIHLRTEQDEYDYFAVMADPEGNEFCINRACSRSAVLVRRSRPSAGGAGGAAVRVPARQKSAAGQHAQCGDRLIMPAADRPVMTAESPIGIERNRPAAPRAASVRVSGHRGDREG